MGLETAAIIGLAGMGIQGASSIYGSWQEGQQMNQQQAWRQQMADRAGGYLQDAPYGYENQIQQMLGGLGGPSAYEEQLSSLLGANGGQRYNTGQDALMQMFRADPYDQTALFEAMLPVEQRLINQQVAGLRGNTSGLGQRFGSAMLREEGNLRGQALENQAARRQQLGFQAYEAQQGRAMNAADLMTRYGLQQQGQQMGGYGQLLGAEQGRMGMQGNLLQMLAQAAQGRQGNNMNILGMMQGFAPQITGSPWAQAGGDMGQLLMMLPLLSQMGGWNLFQQPDPAKV